MTPSMSNFNFKPQTSNKNFTLQTFKPNINFWVQSQASIEGFKPPSQASTLNYKVELQLQSQTPIINVRIQGETSNVENIHFTEIWRSINTSLSTKIRSNWLTNCKIATRLQMDGWSDIVTPWAAHRSLMFKCKL